MNNYRVGVKGSPGNYFSDIIMRPHPGQVLVAKRRMYPSRAPLVWDCLHPFLHKPVFLPQNLLSLVSQQDPKMLHAFLTLQRSADLQR